MQLFDRIHSAVLPVMVLAIVLAGLITPCPAQDDTGYYFMRLPPSAQAAATASSTLRPESTDLQQFLYNPAVLSQTHHRSVRLSYINHLGDLNGGGVAYGHHLPRIGTLGAGIRYLGYGTMNRTNEAGEHTGSFGASDIALTVGLGRSYSENLRIGAAGHFVSSSIDHMRAAALAVDAGLLYDYSPFDLTLGASVNNLGSEVSKLGRSGANLPLDIRIYASKQLQYVPLLLSITGYNLNAIGERTGARDVLTDHLRFGGILQLGSAVEVRFGYNPRRHRAMSTASRLDIAGVTAGFGLHLYRIDFDYTYESWSSFGGLHYLTLGTKL
jgi:hypothetical protein